MAWIHIAVAGMAAQLGFNEPTFEPLPGPGLIEHALLESPWLVAGALLMAGLAGWWWLRGRRRGRLGAIVAGACAVGAVGIVVLARVVTTDREAVIAGTRGLIVAVADADPAALDGLMLDGGYLVPQQGWGEMPKERVLASVRWASEHGGRYAHAGLPRFRVESVRIRQIRARIVSESIARSQVNVVVTLDLGGPPIPSWWGLDWDKTDDGWKVRSVTNLWFPMYGSP